MNDDAWRRSTHYSDTVRIEFGSDERYNRVVARDPAKMTVLSTGIVWSVRLVPLLAALLLCYEFYAFEATRFQIRGVWYKEIFGILRWILDFYAVAEVIFFFYLRSMSARIQALRPAPVSKFNMEKTFSRALRHMGDPIEFLSGWFQGAPIAQIKRDNVVEFLAWAFFAMEQSELSTTQHELINHYIELLDKHLVQHGHPPLKPGSTPTLHAMRLSLDPVPAVDRPLGFYLVMHIVKWLGYKALARYGFERKVTQGLRYWVRMPKTGVVSEEGNLPVVFIHGVGVGAAGYISVLPHLLWRTKSQPFIFLELPEVCFPYPWEEWEILSPDDTANAIAAIMADHHVEKAAFVGHSYGTGVCAWVVKRFPALVARLVVIDPICFLLCLPVTAHTFMYKHAKDDMDVLFEYFIRGEVSLARTMSRHFLWYENILWREDLPVDTTVVLGQDDVLIPAAEIKAYLDGTRSENILEGVTSPESEWTKPRIVWMEGLNHAEFLADGFHVRSIIESVVAPVGGTFNKGPVEEAPQSGWRKDVVKQGNGILPKRGDKITVECVGYLLSSGVQFWSTRTTKPFSFNVGLGKVIRGWDEGMLSMSLGERANLIMSADHAYGVAGMPSWGIPPNAALKFDVEVTDIGR